MTFNENCRELNKACRKLGKTICEECDKNTKEFMIVCGVLYIVGILIVFLFL